jgi:hypothetical protein
VSLLNVSLRSECVVHASRAPATRARSACIPEDRERRSDVTAARNAASPSPAILDVLTAGAAIPQLMGLWTPLAGALVAVAQLARAVLPPAERWTFVHVAALGAALAMLGPGGCSLDGRLFGRKQIQILRR